MLINNNGLTSKTNNTKIINKKQQEQKNKILNLNGSTSSNKLIDQMQRDESSSSSSSSSSSLEETANEYLAQFSQSDQSFNDDTNNNRRVRVLIITESFHPYTSGIARRFKEIIQRLTKRNFLIHVITGCKVSLCFFFFFNFVLLSLLKMFQKLFNKL